MVIVLKTNRLVAVSCGRNGRISTDAESLCGVIIVSSLVVMILVLSITESMVSIKREVLFLELDARQETSRLSAINMIAFLIALSCLWQNDFDYCFRQVIVRVFMLAGACPYGRPKMPVRLFKHTSNKVHCWFVIKPLDLCRMQYRA